MIRWIRVTLPYLEYTLGGFVLVYLVLEAAGWLGYAFSSRPDLFQKDVSAVQDFFILVACGMYGFLRGAAFHPLQRPGYFNWLKTTPWTNERPLPVGPVHLVAQDTVILSAFTLLGLRHGPVVWPYPAILALAVYLSALSITLKVTGPSYVWQGVLFVFGLCFLFLRDSPTVVLVLCLATYIPVYFALRSSLRRFPWPDSEEEVSGYIKACGAWWRRDQDVMIPWVTMISLTAEVASQVGWPYCRLLPEPPLQKQDRVGSVLTSLLCGWWAYLFTTFAFTAAGYERLSEDLALIVFRPVIIITCAVPMIFALMRTISYLFASGRCAAPIGLFGRLATLRWIVPGFDRVFLPLICTAIVGIGGPLMLLEMGMLPHHTVPPFFALAMFITLEMGPSRKKWELTGAFRIPPPMRSDSNYVSPSST